jgi:hypothetical protein
MVMGVRERGKKRERGRERNEEERGREGVIEEEIKRKT